MKVLIVDDEKIVRAGLRKIIEQRAKGFSVIGEAQDGIDALTLVRLYQPDICIVDIRMRHMDGIEFIRRVRQEDSKAHFVVLSGYAEFEYARDLMSIGCSAYLTKPVKHKELITVLNQLKEKILAEAEKAQKIKVYEDLTLKIVDMERDLLVKRILTEGRTSELDSALENHQLLWLREEVTVAAVTSLAPFNDFVSLVDQIFSRSEVEHYICYRYTTSEYYIIMPATYPAFDVLNACCKEISNHLGCEVIAGLEEKVSNLERGLDKAKTIMKSSFPSKQAEVFRASDLPNKPSKDYELVEQRIKTACLNGDPKELSQGIAQLLSDLQNHQTHINVFLLLIGRLYHSVRTKLNQTRYSFIVEQIPTYLAFENQLKSCRQFVEMKEYVQATFDEIASLLSTDVDGSSSSTIRKAQRYIEENFSRDISLSDIAENVGLTPNYLSTLFKTGTGKTYVNYLTELRIERAKVLLVDSSLKVYEVGSMVGYSDPKYFNRVFRQVTGMTPREFRETPTIGSLSR